MHEKTLILVEKPSVANDFAKALGVKEKQYGYMVLGNDYLITWAYGHLLEIDDTDIPKKWESSNLPIFPEKFKYKPVSSGKTQFNVIKKLVKNVHKLIIATDPGREGELIARLILLESGWNKWDNTYRFFTSEALTKETIIKNLKNLKKFNEYDRLYYSALARQHADWLVGINLTRAATLKFNNGLVSIGRVQTPLLKLIYNRELNIRNFKPEEYYIIKVVLNKNGKNLVATLNHKNELEKTEDDDENEINQEEKLCKRLTKKEAEKIINDISNEKYATVLNIKDKKIVEKPPLLHSLNSLQKEANSIYGYSAERVLDIAQDLYEFKLISYPRTDSQFLPESSKELVIDILKKLNKPELTNKVEGNRIFNDKGLTDHYGLIVMDIYNEDNNELRDEHRNIYNLILRRFLGVFMDDYIYRNMTVIFKIKDYEFTSIFKKDEQLGWKVLYDYKGVDTLIQINKGEKLEIKDRKSEQKFTKPPNKYTEGDLIKLMEKIGLGTPATRSGIIETLKKREYIKINKKRINITQKGEDVIKYLINRRISDEKLTGEWENNLNKIENFNKYKGFITDIKGFVNEEIKTFF